MDLVKKARAVLEPPSSVSDHKQQKSIREFFAQFSEKQLVADVGSGHNKYSSRVIGLDIVERSDVDICGNLYDLPLLDNSLDAVIIRGVLEHVEFPERAVGELERVLKPGGLVYSSIPFIQGYHPSPGDFQRYTIEGIQRLFHRFEKVECSITRGAGSSYLWIGREYFSQLLSFNNMTLYKLWKVLLGWLMQPFKYTDLVLNHHRMAHIAASGFTFVGRKTV